MKNRIFNTCLVLTVVVILSVFALYVRVGATADAVVVLRTSGMTCGSCIKTVTKALQSEKGVAATEVDLEGGWVVAGYDSKQVVPEKLARCVAATGYGSTVEMVLTPEQFKKMTGRGIGQQGGGSGCGCCN
jgi:copper chaperone CopZ